MKNVLTALFLILVPLVAHATNKEVSSVGATVSTILTPSNSCQIITIQNNGSGDVRLGIDGGTTNRQKSTPDPTASSGYLLKAGQYLILTYPGNNAPPQIRAILATGTTTTLSVTTNDPYST